MYIKCLNPDCGVAFTHTEGRLIRFSRPKFDNSLPTKRVLVEHYWLCGKCSKVYVFEYDRETGMRIKPRPAEAVQNELSPLASTAW
jgi:hypothetical protein